jgi:hypothetical protein
MKLIAAVLFISIIYHNTAFARDGRDIEAIRKCSKAETNQAIAILESGNGEWTSNRWEQVQLLFSCYGANFKYEEFEKIIANDGVRYNLVTYDIVPINLSVTFQDHDFIRVSKITK